MATEALECQGNRMTDKDKAERLAAALRDNLKRRKAQARELGCNAPAQGGTRVPAGAEKKD
jgi:hypothetical protein